MGSNLNGAESGKAAIDYEKDRPEEHSGRCESASRITLSQVLYSLIPEEAGIRQPSTSLTATAQLPASGLRAYAYVLFAN